MRSTFLLFMVSLLISATAIFHTVDNTEYSVSSGENEVIITSQEMVMSDDAITEQASHSVQKTKSTLPVMKAGNTNIFLSDAAINPNYFGQDYENNQIQRYCCVIQHTANYL
ncbi:hypothetical protein F9U64_21180 [Gracilibacillus oryzae]|uniref:Uncharacterized protein n=1 Tax=Gracilibacillus oryzae TaxID=1672701 RepID=A0A7C8GQR4_9BACI|nr:hypothetical protein [Gracilibacillus oryzae]KAB8125909.1 hypothetical protein F9U64_21180 [Gracilibacillus oryzae]